MVKTKVTENRKCLGTSLKGYLYATYNEIEKKFGEHPYTATVYGKKGPDWSHLQSFEQNTLELIFPATSKDYPLLIE